MTSWREAELTDASLSAYVSARVRAELARAGVELAALKVEHERDQEAIAALTSQVQELTAERKETKKRK